MRKRHCIVSLVLALLLLIGVPAAQSAETLGKELLNNGVVSINYQPANNTPTKVQISKGDVKYTYDLNKNNKFPLQLGSGEYTVSVLEKITGNRYKVVKREQINANILNKNDVYLNSIQLVNWDKDMEIIKKAKELTLHAKNDYEKVTAIHKYVINNISYDYKKASNVSANYIPSIEETIMTKKGICYDYSVLTAAMLRSVGVPTKLMMGYKNDIKAYHAWNQVYLQDSNQWINIDTTYDAAYKQGKASVTMVKQASEYSIVKQY